MTAAIEGRRRLIREILDFVESESAKAPTNSERYHVLLSVSAAVGDMAYGLTRGDDVIQPPMC